MSIYRGSVKAETLYYGGQKIRRVYAGSTLVFDTFHGRTWRNTLYGYYILRGKLYYTGGGSAVQVGAYDDWIDVGLRANGTLWSLDGSTAKPVGNDTGWTDVAGSIALKAGKLYSIYGTTATQVGSYDDYDALFNFAAARRDQTMYSTSGEQISALSEVTGNWHMGPVAAWLDFGVAICDGKLYKTNSPILVDDAGTWTDCDGMVSRRRYDSFWGKNIPLLCSVGIRDGNLCAIAASNRSTAVVSVLDQSGNWQSVTGLFGESYDGNTKYYAYALKTTGALYCLGWNGSASTLTQVGSSTNWKHIFGCDEPRTYSAFAVNSDKKLYKLNSNTATLIG